MRQILRYFEDVCVEWFGLWANQDNLDLPLSFRSVRYLDVFGSLRRRQGSHCSSAETPSHQQYFQFQFSFLSVFEFLWISWFTINLYQFIILITRAVSFCWGISWFSHLHITPRQVLERQKATSLSRERRAAASLGLLKLQVFPTFFSMVLKLSQGYKLLQYSISMYIKSYYTSYHQRDILFSIHVRYIDGISFIFLLQ